ncbi:HAD hydrolase-like protein [Sodalis-like endosymbiont of Proechinophthirus fluctus]|uniref:HAD hydrolase-like protein n=1 Tax=Sodalis-like endosymbiont of Proechinophthirus fluctus TaxID=1462730 RepID=UPI00082B411A|nr:HAD hydrolase-like protein [Sodalis-like endosymbiont of Proechinophthirus fluctus]
MTAGSILFPEVEDTWAQLEFHELPMAVVTNNHMPFVAPPLTLLGIELYFTLIIDGDDVSDKKPHPAPFFSGTRPFRAFMPASCCSSVIYAMISSRLKMPAA